MSKSLHPTRRTVAVRRKMQAIRQKQSEALHPHRTPGWAGEALDMYLEGLNIRELMEYYEIRSSAHFYQVIAREALLRLMESKNVDRLNEIVELEAE